MKNKEPEKDAMIINLTKGYIIANEAKHNLTTKTETYEKESRLSKGLLQLKDALETFQHCARSIKNDWLFIRILYGYKLDTKMPICSNCRKFVVSKKDGPFCEQLKTILLESKISHPKDWTFAQDFHHLVKASKNTNKINVTTDESNVNCHSIMQFCPKN